MTKPYAVLRAGFPYFNTIGEFKRTIFPVDVAVARDRTIYCLSWGSRYGKGKSGPIYITNMDDENLGSFGWRWDREALPLPHASFEWPCQMVMDSAEDLFASDMSSHTISHFTKGGEYKGRWGEQGSALGKLNSPAGLGFDADDNLFVVDSLNHRVQKFTREGRFLGAWGEHGRGPGQFDMPWGIHIDNDNGDVYVADWRNDRIQVFTSDMEFLFEFGTSGSGKGEMRRPSGVAVDHDGDIYVCDWGNNRVQLFNREGRYLQQFLGDATMSRQQLERMFQRSNKQRRMRDDADLEQEKWFARPRSVRVDDLGHMYVPDFEHYRIQIYKKESYPLDETQILPPLRVPTLDAN